MVEKLAHPDLHLIFPIFLSEKQKTCEVFITEWRAAVPAYHPQAAGLAALEQRVRRGFDPLGVFETGRFG